MGEEKKKLGSLQLFVMRKKVKMNFHLLLIPVFILVTKAAGFCWPPGKSPFQGPPKASRKPGGEEVLVDWTTAFKDGPECSDVDFMVMMHPKNRPSAYKISDFTTKGERMTTLFVDPGQDYVFQVIARENKSGNYGIDYKFSDMVSNYISLDNEPSKPTKMSPSQRPMATATTTATTIQPTMAYTDTERYQQFMHGSESAEGLNPNPWYIYECIPFLKDIDGFDEGRKNNYNDVLVSFIRQMNKKPIQIVEEFLESHKSRLQEGKCHNDTKKLPSKGYVVACETSDTGPEKQFCCPNPWPSVCQDPSKVSVCFSEFKSCDGGRCVHQDLVGDKWPDCLDGSDENPDLGNPTQVLPHQLVCVQCAGVVLSAGFICRESENGLSLACVNEVLGYDGTCNFCISQYLNIK